MKGLRRAVTGCLATLAFAYRPAAAQIETGGFRVSGALEHFVGGRVDGSSVTADLTTRWLQVKGETPTGLGFTLGTFEKKTFKCLDENYLQLDRSGSRWRLGRLRAAFGQSDWDDNYYSGLVNMPLMRVTMFAPGFMLSRFDSGLEFRGGGGELEYHAGLVDAASGRNQILPERPNHLLARVQTFQVGAIIGLSALTGPSAVGTELLNLDWRWSSPQWIVRGELLRGRARRQPARGFFVDAYFRPLRQSRTTLLARLESSSNMPGFNVAPGSGYDDPGSVPESAPDSRMATGGIKHSLTRDITLSVTHGWGNTSAVQRGVTGWNFQAIHFLRF